MSAEYLVEVDGVSYAYPGGVQVDLRGLPFHVARGERIAVLGANGAGKSTLLKHILGLLRPANGRVRVFGHDPYREYDAIRARIGALMQNVDEQLIGPTVFDDIAFAPLNFGFSLADTRARVETILRLLEIEHLRDRLPHFLSGGERKKVALAGALVTDPELLVMDEPLSGMDAGSRHELIHFLDILHQQTGITIISTLHDMEHVGELADMVYVMRPGSGLELSGPLQQIFFEYDLNAYNLEPPTTVRLIKMLRRHGYQLEPTLDADKFAEQVLKLIQG